MSRSARPHPGPTSAWRERWSGVSEVAARLGAGARKTSVRALRALRHTWRSSLQFRVVTTTMLLGLLVIMLLGFSSGLPLALSGETLRVWMADSGVDLGTIGLLSLAGLPYTLKFIWAPVVDAWQVPWLSERFGRRRAWLIASQLVLMAAIVFLGTRDPINAPWMIGLGALVLQFPAGAILPPLDPLAVARPVGSAAPGRLVPVYWPDIAPAPPESP